MSMPELRLVDRSGRLLCGWKPDGMDSPDCGRPAVWHVAWSLDAPATFSLVCSEHMGDIREWGHTIADYHHAEVVCDMPGTGWSMDWERPGCVAVTTEDMWGWR